MPRARGKKTVKILIRFLPVKSVDLDILISKSLKSTGMTGCLRLVAGLKGGSEMLPFLERLGFTSVSHLYPSVLEPTCPNPTQALLLPLFPVNAYRQPALSDGQLSAVNPSNGRPIKRSLFCSGGAEKKQTLHTQKHKLIPSPWSFHTTRV